MLRSLLLLLCCFWSLSVFAQEVWLPQAGQTLDIWNRDLTQKTGQTLADVQKDPQLYTLRSDNLPLMHFLLDEKRFTVPGVASTGPAEKFDEPGVRRYVYRGSHHSGAMEKSARIELVRLDDGRCQLSWKLSVINRGERVRQQEGGIGYVCQDLPKTKEHRREAMRLLPVVKR
ncbi:hypothetical protein [Oligoflexus tunisiensis]|uniref:hypothetical protein n=1 Tax=Oligoflexus tunisiensis TaxID=708132 RepID=UPI00114C914A|nr:hypothetical protein [Oligoflexus tunisiensis]